MKNITFTYKLNQVEYIQLFMESITPWIESMGFEVDVLPNRKEWHATYIGDGMSTKMDIDPPEIGLFLKLSLEKESRRTVVFKIEEYTANRRITNALLHIIGPYGSTRARVPCSMLDITVFRDIYWLLYLLIQDL